MRMIALGVFVLAIVCLIIAVWKVLKPRVEVAIKSKQLDVVDDYNALAEKANNSSGTCGIGKSIAAVHKADDEVGQIKDSLKSLKSLD